MFDQRGYQSVPQETHHQGTPASAYPPDHAGDPPMSDALGAAPALLAALTSSVRQGRELAVGQRR